MKRLGTVVVLFGLVSLVGCQSKPPPPPPPAPKVEAPAPEPKMPPRPPECQYDKDCFFGRFCEGGECKQSECWDRKPGIEAKNCPEGMVCEYKDDQGIRHGNGFCFPKREERAPKRRR